MLRVWKGIRKESSKNQIILTIVKELNGYIEKLKTNRDSEKVEELMKLQLEATKALCKALEKESKAEHEKSHLLEPYGAIVLALEEEFQKFWTSK